jgi:diguanylate cyclase (GGDEF)-like protein
MIDFILKLLEKKNIIINVLVMILIFVLIAVTSWLDYTLSNFNLFIFFTFYVVFASLFLGTKPGIIVSLLCAISNLFINMKYLENKWHIIYYLNFSIDLLFFLLILFIVVQLRESLLRERNLSRIDFLTGAYNKRFFTEILSSEMNRSLRFKKTFALAYIDMDNFKYINDTLGHSMGDILLIAFVKILKDNLRQIDTIGRIGGDEFVILLPETESVSGMKTLERLSLLFKDEMEKDKYPVSLSIGLAVFKQAPDSIDEVYKKADLLMYLAKSGGKDRIEVKEFF